MGKIILFNMMTLDGLFAGPAGALDWHHVDSEFNDFAINQLDTAAGLFFGRVTFQGMASYWPTEMAVQNDPTVAKKMNDIPKFVFSRTMDRVDWQNTRLIKDHAIEEAKRIKQGAGKDIFVFGSAGLAASFIQQDLIDEFRIMVNPLILGKGQPLFADVRERIELKLIHARVFENGNVLLSYALSRG